MTKHVVHVPESAVSSRQLKTAGQWLTEFKVMDRAQKSRVHLFPSPVRVGFVHGAYTESDPQSLVCHTSLALFALFQRLKFSGGVICRLTWKGCRIGPKGLYELNHAILTPAVRKGGLNIVRHWLENRRGSLTALAIDFPALLSYLEIRPIHKPNSVIAPLTLSIMSIIRYCYDCAL